MPAAMVISVPIAYIFKFVAHFWMLGTGWCPVCGISLLVLLAPLCGYTPNALHCVKGANPSIVTTFIMLIAIGLVYIY